MLTAREKPFPVETRPEWYRAELHQECNSLVDACLCQRSPRTSFILLNIIAGHAGNIHHTNQCDYTGNVTAHSPAALSAVTIFQSSPS